MTRHDERIHGQAKHEVEDQARRAESEPADARQLHQRRDQSVFDHRLRGAGSSKDQRSRLVGTEDQVDIGKPADFPEDFSPPQTEHEFRTRSIQ